MDTLKTAIVVVLLLAVLYGVYVTLNQPDKEIPEEIAWAQQETIAPLQVDFGDASAGTAAGVNVSLGDSAPWSSDQANGDTHAHDHTIAGAAELATAASAPQASATRYGVAAPELISSSGGTSTANLDLSGQAYGQGTNGTPPATLTGQAGEPAMPSPGYDAGSSFPQNQASHATAVSQPSANSNASVYAQAEPKFDAPAGNYGAPSELSGNPQMVAATEPPVANSYSDEAPPPSSIAATQSPATQSPATQSPATQSSRMDSVLETARGQIEQGQHYEALLTLSFAYSSPGISPEESQQLQKWLDPLAGKVIYSNEHLIGAAYQVQTGETLQSIATKHNVPWQLLANINGLRDPNAVQPGMSIKVVPGPFHAEVDVTNSALTLFAGRLYAGRFAITVSTANAPAPGEYQVADKQPGHSFYAGNAQTLGPQDPQNPYGGAWIDLGGNVSIHGKSSSPGQSERLGCISLAAKDANDLYGILSLGSNVVIRR